MHVWYDGIRKSVFINTCNKLHQFGDDITDNMSLYYNWTINSSKRDTDGWCINNQKYDDIVELFKYTVDQLFINKNTIPYREVKSMQSKNDEQFYDFI